METRRDEMKQWMLGLLAVLFSTTLAVAQQQPTTPMTPQRGEIPQIVAFDNEGLLGDHIHIFGNTPDLGKWGICYFDGTQCQPCAQNPAQCIRQADFLPVDVQAMNQPDTTGQEPLDVVCHDWATFASGTTTTTPGELSLVDCPSKGCLGFAFTLPAGFNGNKTYQQVGRPGSITPSCHGRAAEG